MEIVPTGAALGAEIRGLDARAVAAQFERDSLGQALARHRVLLLRDQQLGVDEQIRFAQVFGELGAIADTLLGMGRRAYQPGEIPECVSVISNIEFDGKKIGSLGDGECLWHTDSCFAETPPSASVLYALEIPPEGGNTAFLDMIAALETLTPHLRDRIEGKRIRHSRVYDSTGARRAAFAEVEDVSRSSGPEHPIVRTLPETGVQSLYLGRRLGAYVVGLPVEESERLLDALWAHAVGPERCWSHTWRIGDVLVWDNRVTMHHRDPFDPRARRRLHKVQVAGERPA